MAARADAMSKPSNSIPHLPHLDLLRRLGVVFFIALAVAAGFAGIYKVNATILPQALVITFAVGQGLACGFAARWILRGRIGLLRGLVAVASLIFGLSLLGMITFGVAGIKLLDRTRAEPDWGGLAQIALGTVAAWLALRSWRTAASPQSILRGPEPSVPRPARKAPATKSRRRRERAAAAPRTQRQLHWLALPRLRRPVLPRLHLPTLSRPGFRLALRLRRRQSQVRLEQNEEHRCPYCLEPVSRSDPRGFVVCKICHTYHHADCWAVTGMCQVPHHHD